uniref:cilia- and flagella-associated protein 65 isoform X2 n=1 Tax=Solea senegalensis TaxID=28829 RepID=UPI001CD85B90|nr:cilia- and flagella-associated protein 65 isoform X2 [Solea senegalensis]
MSAMLAGQRGTNRHLNPLGSNAPLQPPSAGKDSKDPGAHHSRQERKHLQNVSSKRSCQFGLETKSELVWKDWDLGKEFPKTLVLRNIQNKLQRLSVRPPVSKFFTTVTTPHILLSPGTTCSIPIIFTPRKKCDYEDSIEFQGKDGSFQVRLHATVPCPALEVPDSVLLPLCAVQHSTHTTFLLKNASKLQTYFRWVCEVPFQLSPDHGLLKPNQECHITVEFRPEEAQVYQQQAYCKFGEEDKTESYCTVLLQAQAKNPCLQLRNPVTGKEKEHWDPVLLFGSVGVGQSLQKHFDISNPSPVTASFSLSFLPGMVSLSGSVFSCDVMKGEVAPGGSRRVGVTYSPAVVDMVSVEYLSLECRGTPEETLLKLTGSCRGPNVSLSSSVVDFGFVKEGGSVKQTVTLHNYSPVETLYQWDIDCNGHSVFSIQPASGTVQPWSHITLNAIYRPTQPIAHNRRVPCLILHGKPLFLELNGACHPEDLDLPDTVRAMQQAHKSNERLDSEMLKTPMDQYYQTFSPCTDSPHVCVLPHELLFNHKITKSLTTSSTSSQSVAITNHTAEKLSVVWTIAKDSPFSVSPLSSDLAPMKATSFRVTYDPKELNTLHGAQLECFAYHKMANLTGERLLCSCVIVRVIGHSFQPGKIHFNPCCILEPPQVVFTGTDALSYQMVLLKNSGHLPLTFCLGSSSKSTLAESVSVFPNCGLIQPRNHQILTLRKTPTEGCPNEGFSVRLQFNAAKYTQEMTVVNVVEKLSMSLEGDGSLNFPPTAVGSLTRRSHYIRNLSSLPIRFQWSIPELDKELITVAPDAGELNSNEISIQTWSFSPLTDKTYTIEAILTFWLVQTDEHKKSHLTLKVVGMGSKGFIKAEKAVLDAEEILVGSYQSVEIPLVNNSPCAVSFCLSVQQTLLDEGLVYDPETEPRALQLDFERGTIAPHSMMLLPSTVRPYRRAQYLCKISYQILNASGLVSSLPHAVCEVRAKGVVPILQVTDVCGFGSIKRLGKRPLWKILSLDSLNHHLLSTPSASEVTHGTPTRYCLRTCPSTTKTILDFNFNAAPMDSAPSTFVLMFDNPDSFPVDWAFLFPEDQQTAQWDHWSQIGAFSSTELSKLKDQGKRLFNVSPRSGTLLPGQKKAVRFSYSHEITGKNQLPVVFTQSYGREILLNFQGLTVETSRSYLHYASNNYVFAPVFIGDCSPPKQGFKLHNAGALPAHYEVDSAVLLQLQMDNFNHAVLYCVNPEGGVPPGEPVMLEWIFSPLEAKLYQMDIPIHIDNGDTTVVRFEGCGLAAPSLDNSSACDCSDDNSADPCQGVPVPGQVRATMNIAKTSTVFLSEESASLGYIPIYKQSSRILFLNNVSGTDTVQYTWDMSQQSDQQVVHFHPEQGRLSPGEIALCVLTVTATDYPTIYQLDLTCQITQEAALNQYHKALHRWEEEKKRREVEFVITDKKETRTQREKMTKLQEQPEPPHPTQLLLEVTAHSYRPQHVFLSQLQSVKHPEVCHAAGKDIVVHILSTLLWNILDDLDFSKLERPVRSAVRPKKLLLKRQHTELVPAELSKMVLSSTIQNLMMEAVRGELELTGYPRSIILPPVSPRWISRARAEQNSKKRLRT